MATKQQSNEPSTNQRPTRYGLWRIVLIVLSGHLGVRPAHKRKEDFQHVKGIHVFFVAVIYFLLIISSLIALVNYIAR